MNVYWCIATTSHLCLQHDGYVLPKLVVLCYGVLAWLSVWSKVQTVYT